MISKVVFDGKYPADRCMLCWQQTAESTVDASVQWSHNDIEALLDAVRTLGPYAWNQISSQVFDGRMTALHCMLRWREVDQSKSSLPTAGTLVRPKHMQKVKETLAAPPQFGLGREEKNMNASSVASLVGEEKKTDVQVVESKADVALSAKIKTEEVDTDDDAEDESADVPLSAKVKTEEVEGFRWQDDGTSLYAPLERS